MVIPSSSNISIGDLLKAQSMGQPNRTVHKGPGWTSFTPDQATISGHGIDLARIRDAVRNAPDVREDKVAELRGAITQGSYQMSPAEIAKALLAARTR